MSMIVYVMVHIKRAEYIKNNRRIQKIARVTLVTTVNVDDVDAALPLCIEIGLHNPVTSDWIRLVGATAEPLNVTALVRDTLMLENKKCKDTGYSHTCKSILFAGLYQHRVKTGAPAEGGITANHLQVHAGDTGGITGREESSPGGKVQCHIATYHWAVLQRNLPFVVSSIKLIM
jgi:hypothetical protein